MLNLLKSKANNNNQLTNSPIVTGFLDVFERINYFQYCVRSSESASQSLNLDFARCLPDCNLLKIMLNRSRAKVVADGD